jgi:hypothetical protein
MFSNLPKKEGLIGGQYEIRDYRYGHSSSRRLDRFRNG